MWAWSVERQLKALGDLWDADDSFRDTLTAERAKAPGRVRPEWLTERAAMLRPSGRHQDEIHVATLLALAVSEADLVDVIAAAARRSATIIVCDADMTIPPASDANDINAAVGAWQMAKTLARSVPGRLEGVRVAAQKKRAMTLRKVCVARPLWRDTQATRLSTEQVAEAAQLSVKTLYNELGRRPRIKGRGQTDAE